MTSPDSRAALADELPFNPEAYSAFKRAATMSTEAFMPMDENAPHSDVEQMRAALMEAERFMAYFANETDGHFVGDGTPTSCLAQIRAALRSPSPYSGAVARALKPFANAAYAFSSAIGPDGIDDGITVVATMHGSGREAILSTTDFSRAATAFAAAISTSPTSVMPDEPK